MGNDYKKEALKEYMRYFRIWFIIVGVLAVIAAVSAGVRIAANHTSRNNGSAGSTPVERVYDYADVLTDGEEEKLRSQIAEAEERLHMDIVIVTFNESVEGEEAQERFGSRYWEVNMQTLADDFWDENGYGYNKSFEGDGMLLLHNWYEGQNGEHLSTSGRAESYLSGSDIDQLLNRVDRYYDTDPYMAYSDFLKAVVATFDGSVLVNLSFFLGAFFLSAVVAVIYACIGLHNTKAKDTTAVNAYVAGGKPAMRFTRDDFIRKHVTQRHIERSSSGGSGHSGGGGHHTSRSGASHGGGSHRH